jgi:predicted RNase H-like HicB family nuclease
MRYTILLEQLPDGTYEASIPAILRITERGENRAAALAGIERALRSKLRNVELLELEIPTPQNANVRLETAGMFADDPDLESIVEEIYAARDASKGE